MTSEENLREAAQEAADLLDSYGVYRSASWFSERVDDVRYDLHHALSGVIPMEGRVKERHDKRLIADVKKAVEAGVREANELIAKLEKELK